MDVANFQVENGEAGVLISELLNGKLIVESYTPPALNFFVDPDTPTIRTANGGEYVCRTANPSIASEKYAICENIAWRIGLLCGYLEGEKDQRTAQKLQSLADLEPIRKEIIEWFLLAAKTLPTDDELRLIVRDLMPAYIGRKLDGTVLESEKYRKSDRFSIVLYDAKNPDRIGTIECKDCTNANESGIPKQVHDFISKLYELASLRN
jgi:hypothetical protein